MNNDLISREYVKAKIFDIPKPKEGATFWDGVDTVGDIIDNAPTIPLPDFKDGYKQAIIDGKTNFSRPQGEWNEIQAGMFACPFCGARPHKDFKNFCAKCGADMRKGGAENDSRRFETIT